MNIASMVLEVLLAEGVDFTREEAKKLDKVRLVEYSKPRKYKPRKIASKKIYGF